MWQCYSDVGVSLKVTESIASGGKVCFVGVHWTPQQKELMTGLNTLHFEDALSVGKWAAPQY